MAETDTVSYDSLYRQIANGAVQARSRLTGASDNERAVQDILERAGAADLEKLADDDRSPASPVRRIAHAAVVDLLATADHFGGDVVGILSALAEALETPPPPKRPAGPDVISGTIPVHHPS